MALLLQPLPGRRRVTSTQRGACIELTPTDMESLNIHPDQEVEIGIAPWSQSIAVQQFPFVPLGANARHTHDKIAEEVAYASL